MPSSPRRPSRSVTSAPPPPPSAATYNQHPAEDVAEVDDYTRHTQWLQFLGNYKRSLDKLERDVHALTTVAYSPPKKAKKQTLQQHLRTHPAAPLNNNSSSRSKSATRRRQAETPATATMAKPTVNTNDAVHNVKGVAVVTIAEKEMQGEGDAPDSGHVREEAEYDYKPLSEIVQETAQQVVDTLVASTTESTGQDLLLQPALSQEPVPTTVISPAPTSDDNVEEVRKIKERHTQDHIRSLVFNDHHVDSVQPKAANANALFSGALVPGALVFGSTPSLSGNEPVDESAQMQRLTKKLVEKNSTISALTLKVKQLERELRWTKLEKVAPASDYTEATETAPQQNCGHDMPAIEHEMQTLQLRLQRQASELLSLENQNQLLKTENCRLIEQEALVKKHLQQAGLPTVAPSTDGPKRADAEPASVKALLQRLDEVKSRLTSHRGTFEALAHTAADLGRGKSAPASMAAHVSALIDMLTCLRTTILTADSLQSSAVAGYAELLDQMHRATVELDQLVAYHQRQRDQPNGFTDSAFAASHQHRQEGSLLFGMQDDGSASSSADDLVDPHALTELGKLQAQNAALREELKRMYAQIRHQQAPSRRRSASWMSTVGGPSSRPDTGDDLQLLQRMQELEAENARLRAGRHHTSPSRHGDVAVQGMYAQLKKVEAELETLRLERALDSARQAASSPGVKLDFVLPVNHGRSQSEPPTAQQHPAHIGVVLPSMPVPPPPQQHQAPASSHPEKSPLDLGAVANVLEMHRLTQQKLVDANEQIRSMELDMAVLQQQNRALEQQLEDADQRYEEAAQQRQQHATELGEHDRDHARRVDLLKDEINELALVNREKEATLTQLQTRVAMYEAELARMDEHIGQQTQQLHAQAQLFQQEQARATTSTTAMLEKLMKAIQDSYVVTNTARPPAQSEPAAATTTAQMVEMMKTMLAQQHPHQQQPQQSSPHTTASTVASAPPNAALVSELRQAVETQIAQSKDLKSENERLRQEALAAQQRSAEAEARMKAQEADWQVQLSQAQSQLDVAKLRIASLERCLEQYRIQYKGIQRLQASSVGSTRQSSKNDGGASVDDDGLDEDGYSNSNEDDSDEALRIEHDARLALRSDSASSAAPADQPLRPYPFFVAFTHAHKYAAHVRRQLRKTQQQLASLHSDLIGRQSDLAAAQKQVDHLSSLLGSSESERDRERAATRQQHARELDALRRQADDLAHRLQLAENSKRVLQAQLGKVVHGVGAYLKAGLVLDGSNAQAEVPPRSSAL